MEISLTHCGNGANDVQTECLNIPSVSIPVSELSVPDNFPEIIDSLWSECFHDVFRKDDRFSGQWTCLMRFSSLFHHEFFGKRMEIFKQKFASWIEFRSRFSTLIEKIDWQAVSCNQFISQDERKLLARKCIHQLSREVCQAHCSPVFRQDASIFKGWLDVLRDYDTSNPMKFVEILQDMLVSEEYLIKIALRLPEFHHKLYPERKNNLHKNVELFEGKMKEFVSALETIRSSIKAFHKGAEFQFEDGTELVETTCDALQLSFNSLSTQMWKIGKLTEDLRLSVSSIIASIKNEIRIWSQGQAFANNGIHVAQKDTIDHLEVSCKKLLYGLLLCMEAIKQLQYVFSDAQFDILPLQEMLQQYENMVMELVNSCLFVERQPPQVLKKNTLFGCGLSHLLANELKLQKCQVSAVLISPSDALQITRDQQLSPQATACISGTNQLENHFQKENSRISFSWKRLELKEDPPNRGKTDCVTNEKPCMLFTLSMEFLLHEKPCHITAKALSLPLVVVVAGKQVNPAQGTIFWSNAASINRNYPFFVLTRLVRPIKNLGAEDSWLILDLSYVLHQQIREPFEVPLELPLFVLLDNLDGIWRKNCSSPNANALSLNEAARNFIIKKIFGHVDVDLCTMVSWKRIHHENLQEKHFTFWKYFSEIMALTASPFLKKFWNDGQLIGFVNREDCEEMLQERSEGVFLFRFSQGLCGKKQRGGLVLSCFGYNKETKTIGLGHHSPYTVRDLDSDVSLSEIVHSKDGNPFTMRFLYPDISKEVIFGQKGVSHMSSDGYIPR